MQIDYTIDEERNLVEVTCVGRLEIGAIRAHFLRVHADPAFSPAMNSLIDVTRIETTGRPRFKAFLVGIMKMVFARRGATRWAFVAGERRGEYAFTLFDRWSEGKPIRARFFEHAAEAEAWATEDRAPDAAERGAAPSWSGVPLQSPPKALIVEDNELTRRMFERVLTSSGYDCVSVDTATKAQTFLCNETVDFLVTDLQLPGMSGMELIEWVRVERRLIDLTIVVHSGVAHSVSTEMRLRLGIAEVFAKGSYTVADVRERLAEALMIDAP